MHVTLVGASVRLEPLALHHVSGLLAAARGPRDTYRFTDVPDSEDAMRRYVEAALTAAADARALPFATIDVAAERIVGSTRFGNLERWSWPVVAGSSSPAGIDAVEIGWTWLAATAQRTRVNTEAKRLMLGHAFEVWHVERVTLKTDARNQRSRAAIERVGGRLDGLLRGHMPAADGTVRTSAVYSVMRDEWPAVRARLDERLGLRSAPR